MLGWRGELRHAATGSGAHGRRLVAVVALVKTSLAVSGTLATAFFFGTPLAELRLVPWLICLSFTLCSLLCFWGGGRDRRSLYLGITLILVAAPFADVLMVEIRVLAGSGAFSWLASILLATRVEAFLPVFFWLFLRDFPRDLPYTNVRRPLESALRISLVAGVALFVVNFFHALDPNGHGVLHVAARLLTRQERYSLYWPILLLLTIPGLGFLLWRARHARGGERRRVNLFVFGLVLGFAPIAVEVLLESLIPPYLAYVHQPGVETVFAYLIFTPLLLVPLLTTYSVVIDRVINVKFILRQGLRYAMARYTVLAAIAAPFAVFAVYLYANRLQPLSAAFAGQGAFAAGALALGGTLALRMRSRVLSALDRRFFREQVDAREILSSLVERIQGAVDVFSLHQMLREEIDRALHPQSVHLLVGEQSVEKLVCLDGSGVPPFDSHSVLSKTITDASRPLRLDMEAKGSLIQELPEADRHWIADCGARLLVPLKTPQSALMGLLVLGEKKSELAFSTEDLSLLGLIGQSVSLALENMSLRRTLGSSGIGRGGTSPRGSLLPYGAEPARECQVCAGVTSHTKSTCSCGGALVEAKVPLFLNNKFQLQKRIGVGGMGVVYKALDVTLGREVAVKTLPRGSLERALRLRREARAMASVTHRHLAMIFGAESWRGVPLLVIEFLRGGTLADRLRDKTLGPREVVQLGIILSSVLETLHSVGILHRDVKPSNIGYTRDNVPKLMDFGLAKMIEEAAPDGKRVPRAGPMKAKEEGWATQDHMLLGTPNYMCPEAVEGREPDGYFDLWSLAVTLLEALTGVNPYRGSSLSETLRLIRFAEAPDVGVMMSECPEALNAFFAAALSPSLRRRPQTAAELRQRLETLAF